MKSTINLIWLFITPLFISIGCTKDNYTPTPNPPTGIVETTLIKLEDALNLCDSDFVNLINKTRGSVGTNGSGSKVFWSKKNDFFLGLFISANHVYGINSWSSLIEEFIDLNLINNGIYIGSQIPPANGSVNLSNELNANFGLYHPKTPSNATNTNIIPKDNFYLGIIDNQRIIDNGLGNYPNFVQTLTPLQMYDPTNRTQATQTWAISNTNEIVMAIGYPQDKAKYPNGVVSTGKVYSDLKAESIIQSLKQKGDVEGDIPYNPQVEFLANIEAVAGMSGGGVFNSEGQLVGIMVRATVLSAKPVLRVIRMTYIIQELNAFYDALHVVKRKQNQTIY